MVTPTQAVVATVTPVGRAINLEKVNVNQISDEKSLKKLHKEKPNKNVATVLSINEGKMVDADGVSTLYYTTKAIGSYINDLYTQLTEKTSSLNIDETKKKLLAEANTAHVDNKHKTGLVRVIDGKMVANHTTTIYQSKVIGTIIDNRYAQIIESTSSYIIDKTQEPNIAPSATVSNEVKPTAAVISPSAAVLEGSLSSDADGHYNDEESEDDEENEDDENADEVDENGRKKSRLTFATKKRTFTPIIRPFASRNRPTFAPKRKNLVASSATIITRNDFTPTITATPVSKAETSTRRFSGGRRSSNAPHVAAAPSSSASSSTFGASKRFSRLRTSSTAALPSSTTSTGSSRIRPTATRTSSTNAVHFGSSSSRRAGNLFRSSTLASRSIAPSQVGRFRVSPTSSATQTTPKLHDSDDVTTQDPNENANTEHIENADGDSEDEVATTTENARRNQNPLLRFRRPVASSSTTRFQPTTTPKAQTTVAVSTRRSPLQRSRSAQTSTTTTTTAKPKARSFQKPASLAALTNRPRVQSNNLFPPRGLFRQTTPAADSLDKDENNNVTGDGDSGDAQHPDEANDSDDIDVEGNEDSVDIEYDNRNRRENKAPAFTPQSSLRTRKRTKRQADYGTRTARSRRPSTAQAASSQQITQRVSYDDAYYDDIDYVTQKPQKAPSITSRYQSRYRPPTPSSNQNIDSHSESNHNSQNANANSRNIRPTKASVQKNRSQFTLRSGNDNKEVSNSGFTPPSRTSNFRRTQNSANVNNGFVPTTSSRRKPLPQSQASRSKSSRLRSYSPYSETRNGNSRGRSGSSSTRGTTRSSTRSRNGRVNAEVIDEYVPPFDGTITVTHHIPTEVTIPIVNGKNTEYKNIITAKVSTEILGPNQYSTTTRGIGGNTALILTNEVTSLINGATEITQFVLKETPTTSVTFTPTLIRGRKTSFSHVVPSTVYNVENVVSTIQPPISSNAPLANILLSQLLLGNFGLPQQQLLGLAQPQQLQPIAQTPTTEYKTRTTTYVTTVTNAKSTILPLTYRGKEILTTVVESSTYLF